MTAAPHVAQALHRATARLAEAGVPSPRADAEILLAYVAGVPRGDVRRAAVLDACLDELAPSPSPASTGTGLPLHSEDTDDERQIAQRYLRVVDRRAAREPLQHITGSAPFRYLELAVGPGVFVPRPETEQVAQVAIDEATRVAAQRSTVSVVDLCTGSGAIALAVATEVPAARVVAVELDEVAHRWACQNAQRTVALTGRSVQIVRGDARRALSGGPDEGGWDSQCDVVVANPPYIPSDAVPRDREVADFDPPVALYGLGADGLEVPRGIIDAAARLLRMGGLFVMEHAEGQAAQVRALVHRCGAFDEIATRPDLAGRERMVVARRSVRRTDMEDCAP